MINFVDEKYGTTVSSSQVSQDGFEASNLLLSNSKYISKNKGFLVEYFIKPPVEVLLTFPIRIEISSISLGLRVGGQLTNGIEILATYDQSSNAVFQSVFHQCPISTEHLTIQNVTFKPRHPFTRESCDCKLSFSAEATFKNCHHLGSVQSLKIKIIRTSGSSVPALGCVKVLGQPARSCLSKDRDRIFQLCASPSVVTLEDDDDIQILEPENPKASESSNAAIHIPEEFVDPLTFEIMSLPVLLPSGQSVDSSTLEKVNNSQASWGRLPYDPFTGIPFGTGKKPVRNHALKARIDAFLVKNGHLDPHLATVPRTLGTSQNKTVCKTPLNTALASSSFLPSERSNLEHSQCLVKSVEVQALKRQCNSHEVALQDSLQQALQSCLNKALTIKPHHRKDNGKLCSGCSQTIGCTFYKLPCGHRLCRPCLLGANESCVECKGKFLKKDVSRIYNVP